MDWDEFSEVTGFEEGKGTWASAGILWMAANGFRVKHICDVDYQALADKGADYIIEYAGAETGKWMVEHTNVPAERTRAKKLVESGLAEKRIPTIDDIRLLLDKGYLVRVGVNSRRLNNQDGFFGHAVVIIGYDKNGLVFHDPGPPSEKARKASYKDFEAAWADPNETTKELDAIKLKT